MLKKYCLRLKVSSQNKIRTYPTSGSGNGAALSRAVPLRGQYTSDFPPLRTSALSRVLRLHETSSHQFSRRRAQLFRCMGRRFDKAVRKVFRKPHGSRKLKVGCLIRLAGTGWFVILYQNPSRDTDDRRAADSDRDRGIQNAAARSGIRTRGPLLILFLAILVAVWSRLVARRLLALRQSEHFFAVVDRKIALPRSNAHGPVGIDDVKLCPGISRGSDANVSSDGANFLRSGDRDSTVLQFDGFPLELHE